MAAPRHGSIWVDGFPAQVLPLPDRGLDYGDGVFETLLLRDGTPLHLSLHLQRLQEGLQVLGFPPCLEELKRQIHCVLSAGKIPGESVMRVTVTRGGGPRGYAPPATVIPRIIIVTTERVGGSHLTMLRSAHLALAEIRWSSQPALVGIKHLNRLEQVLAAQEREAAGVDELVMLNQLGQVVSVSAGNLFIMEGGSLLTPEITQCGVRGTRRRLILESLAPQLGLPVAEVEITLVQLQSAEEVFYCNALVGVRPVASFAAASWNRHEVCGALHRLLYEAEK